MSSFPVSEFLKGDLNQFFEGAAVSYKDPFKPCLDSRSDCDTGLKIFL